MVDLNCLGIGQGMDSLRVKQFFCLVGRFAGPHLIDNIYVAWKFTAISRLLGRSTLKIAVIFHGF